MSDYHQPRLGKGKGLKRVGWRPPPIAPQYKSLLQQIAESRGLDKSEVIELALKSFASEDEIETAWGKALE